ncbi:type I phosphomannose isomerase catalytic subunit [Thermobrachium celere]|uniref:type I phosphomannose isomerase catalytic subunit n=1 Tax=Thermobrachium celere TaxID=53422 RepID=UPI0019439BFD|nr:type I phosphomannose isomerase catalytic subunit [Thermobrachium celere]GFR34330.1 mannose-6-phosphate isomerase [Thermobrachium celere]
MLYPLFFQPVYKETIWGGQNLKKLFHRELPYQKTAESWEVCCHKNGISIIENGIFKGKSIIEAINVYKIDLIGNKGLKFDTFPLLIKYIDANDNLSVQVHPDDEYALKNEGEFGKTEVWYVLSAKENAKIIYGVKNGITKDEFKKNILKNNIEECLNFVSVKKGDVIFIPPGTVHALLEGIVVAEIQQNSDTTYRIYDWNRVDKDGNPRKLHVDKALDVMDFNLNGTICNPTFSKFKTYSIANISKCKYFNVDEIIVHDKYQDETTGESFYIFMCIEGSGLLHYKGDSYSIPAGKTFMIPAKKEKFLIEGELNLLKVYL